MNTENLEKLDSFPVGRVFWTKKGNNPVKFGWVIGYAINPCGELVFKVKWAHRDMEQLLHPSNVNSLLTDWQSNTTASSPELDEAKQSEDL